MAIKESKIWDGKGLPPVGCECEIMESSVESPKRVKIIAHFQNSAAMVAAYIPVENKHKTVEQAIACCFRPIRSEEDKKRDAAIEKITAAICGEIPDTGMATAAKYAARVYDAVAAGEITGIRLE